MSASRKTDALPNAPLPLFGETEMARLVRDFDWSGTSLGALTQWPQSRRSIVETTLASGLPAVTLWGPDLLQIYNDGYRRIMGEKHPKGLGEATRDCWPEVWSFNAPIYERVHQGETITFEDKRYAVAGPGGRQDRWFTLSYSPLRDETGAIAGVLVVLIETSARVSAERLRTHAQEKLRESESRFQSFAENSPNGLWIMDAQTKRFAYANPAFGRLWDGSRERLLDDPRHWLALVHPDDLGFARDTLRRAFEGETVQAVYRLVEQGEDGPRWIRDTAFPIIGEDGTLRHVGGVSQDVTQERNMAERLRENQRRLWTLIEGIPQLLWRSGSDGRWTWASGQWCDYTGRSLRDSLGLGWLDALHPDDRARARTDWERALTASSIDMETRLFHAGEDRYRWFRTRALPIRDETGAIVEWLGTSTDIDDLRELQDRQSILVAELQHRTRNLMGVVRAIANRTAVSAASSQAFLAVFRERLEALARANDLLSRLEQGQRVFFHDLVLTELSARGVTRDGDGGERLVLEGPRDVRLRSSAVQTFALALHELTTNAVKYGALAGGHGSLALRWRVYRESGARRLHVEWRESGVENMPAQGAPPSGGGYGRELIEKALPYQLKARTTYEFLPDGVLCTIDLPLDRLGPGADLAGAPSSWHKASRREGNQT